jgi:hypothetical protein
MFDFNLFNDNMTISIFALVAIPIVLIALFLLLFALSARRKVRRSQSWEQTLGTVLFSMVETRRGSSGGGGTTTSYYPKIVYEYRVMGQVYHGDRFNLGEVGLGSYNRVAATVAEYPVGKHIEVFFNPDNPVEAVLQRKAPSSNLLIFIVVVILASLGCTAAMMIGGMSLMNQFIGTIFANIPQ